MVKKIFCAAVLLISASGHLRAQLTGRVTDDKGPVPYAGVSLLLAGDSSVVGGSATDDNGNFVIPTPVAGTYILRITAMPYLGQYSKPFTVTGSQFKNEFGVFSLKQDTRVLGEVTVKALRPSVIMRSDKLIIPVEGTALAAGSTAFEVLERSPGVSADNDGNLKLNGKSGVRVLIDGRASFLSGKELQAMLESMPAQNIKSIEVITNPSAKYEAAGSSGILNIRLKHNTSSGMNGSTYAGYQYNAASGYSGGASINFKKGKWNSYVNADMAQRPRMREGVMIREFHSQTANSRFHQLRDEKMTVGTPSLRAGTDYDLNGKHTIGTFINLSYSDTDRSFLSTTQLDDRTRNELNSIRAGNYYRAWNRSGAYNLHYSWLPDTTGTNFTANIDYIQLDNQTRARYENSYTTAGTARNELLRTENPGYYDIISANADLVTRISRHVTFETGIKGSRVVSGNKLNFYTVSTAGETLDPLRTNNYRYTENILAGYGNIQAKLNKTWNIQAGLRGEKTLGTGEPLMRGSTVRKSYFDLFPSIFLTQDISRDYQVTYNYSRRIDRPNYRSLNPFIFYQDPYSWAEGNPGLRPQYSNVFQIGQTLKKTYILTLGYTLTNDSFAEVPEQNTDDNTTVYQERNIDKAENYSATLIVPVRINRSWEATNTVVGGLEKNKIFFNNNEIINDQVFTTLQSAHHIALPYSLQLQATASYSSPSTFGIYRFKEQWWLDAGLKRTVWNKKLDLTLGVTDIFRTRDIRGDASYNGNIFNFVNYFMMRGARLNVRYNFRSGDAFKSKHRKTVLDEVSRAGG